MKIRRPNSIKRESGQTMLETAMLLPWLFLIIFGIIEFTLYLYTRNVVNYAAYMAARSAVAYGERKLESIEYPVTGGGNETSSEQRIVEAMAEKIIFESLPWERRRIRQLEDPTADDYYRKRVYYDQRGNTGGVRIEEINVTDKKASVKLLYCMPVHFKLHKYFLPDFLGQPCTKFSAANKKTVSGIPIMEKVTLQIVN